METEIRVFQSFFAELATPTLLIASGHIVAANGEAERLLGLTRWELAGRKVVDLEPLCSDAAGDIFATELEAVRSEESRSFPWRVRCADGSHIPIDVQVRRLDIGGEDDFCSVTLQRIVTGPLNATPRREHRLIDILPYVVFETDAYGRWSYLNPAWEEITGTGIAEAIGAHFLDYIHQDDRERSFAQFRSLMDGERPSVETQVRFSTNGGSHRPLNVFARAVRAPDGAITGTAGTFVDVSEREGLLRELQAQRERLEKEVAARTAELRESNSQLREQKLERERLLARREQQIALSRWTAQAIVAETPLDRLFAELVTRIQEEFAYFHVQLLQYDAIRGTVALVAAAGRAASVLLSERLEIPEGAGLVGKAARDGRAFLRADLTIDGHDRSPVLLPQTKGELAVPIKEGKRVLGVLSVQSDRPGMLGDDDRLLLEGLSGQIATAIESTRLREEMRAQLAELRNLQRLMSRDAWLAYRATSTDGLAGYRFDRRGLRTDPVTSADSEFRIAGDGREAAGGETASTKADGVMSSPLVVRGERVGTLGVDADPQRPLLQEEVELLESVSLQVAEALESARLLEQTQKRAVELETVSRVSAAASTILETEKLLQAVVELTKRSFNLYHAHVYLLDEKANALVLAAGSGEAGQAMVVEGWKIKLDHPNSIVARAAREREGIINNHTRQGDNFLANPLLPETRAELAVPMIAGSRLLGVMDVQADRIDFFTDEDVRIQTALAGQVAVAVQNSRLYEEQIETAEKLREFDRLKSEFLASMSHELRTPLNSIIGFADVLLEGIDGELNERMEEDVVLIRNSGQHLRELIGDILDMSKIEAGMMALHFEPVRPQEMRREIEAFARTQLMVYDKDLEFTMEVSPEVEVLTADRTRLRQIIYNLVSNAVKFTSDGGVKLSITRADGMARFAVSDTGIGIDEADMAAVFEQFRQVDGSLTRAAGGTGLGLPISKSLVELHGGEIWAESSPGEGTTFYFTIPLRKQAGGSNRPPIEAT